MSLFILSGRLTAQLSDDSDPGMDSLSRYIETSYGLDQQLFNGFQYYKRYVQYKGDPFFPEDSFYDGSVTISGVEYDNISLKYNCYTRSLILEYTDLEERYNQLRLNNFHIDSFTLGVYCFQKLSLFGEEPEFYQVLGASPVIIYIRWEKNIHSTHDDMKFSYEYTRALGTCFLGYEGNIRAFNSRRSFVALFPESLQGEILKFIRDQGLSFGKAGPADFQKLLDYVSQLPDKPSVD